MHLRVPPHPRAARTAFVHPEPAGVTGQLRLLRVTVVGASRGLDLLLKVAAEATREAATHCVSPGAPGSFQGPESSCSCSHHSSLRLDGVLKGKNYTEEHVFSLDPSGISVLSKAPVLKGMYLAPGDHCARVSKPCRKPRQRQTPSCLWEDTTWMLRCRQVGLDAVILSVS